MAEYVHVIVQSKEKDRIDLIQSGLGCRKKTKIVHKKKNGCQVYVFRQTNECFGQ